MSEKRLDRSNSVQSWRKRDRSVWHQLEDLSWSDIFDNDALSHIRRISIILFISLLWISFSSNASYDPATPPTKKTDSMVDRPHLDASNSHSASKRGDLSDDIRVQLEKDSLISLTMPVAGVQEVDLVDTFHEKRGSDRIHHAIDIIAAENTPVVAATGGTAARLVTEPGGGIALYQRESSGNYVLYYAHLSGYAPGLNEGDRISQGQTIGYVGSTGNARTPHLHFAVRKHASSDRWCKGKPVNPYSLLTSR